MKIQIIVLLFMILSCTKEITELDEPEPEPVIFTSSETVCECHNSAVSIFRALLVMEKLEYKKAFWQLREECLTSFGVLLYYPSECNYPDYLAYLADSLISVGIDINSP